uniref:Uncharacterized protein n=1 Tax=Romanomermis culicivorax TaxID=13658 RepID=A0A915I154_ROMCU
MTLISVVIRFVQKKIEAGSAIIYIVIDLYFCGGYQPKYKVPRLDNYHDCQSRGNTEFASMLYKIRYSQLIHPLLARRLQ